MKKPYRTEVNPGLSFPVLLLCLAFQVLPLTLFAQDEAEEEEPEMKEAVIRLEFSQTDSTRTCKAVVMSDSTPVTETDVHFYVQRSFSLLPIGETVATDENGEASVEFPMDLPGDPSGNLKVIARIEDDEVYGSPETFAEVKWGVKLNAEDEHWGKRSLSASRDKAPTYLILVSNLIIGGIWGTIFYVIFQVFRIKKLSRLNHKP